MIAFSKAARHLSINSVINGMNVDGKVYLSDVDEWTNYSLPMNKVRDLRDKLTEMRDGKN